MKLRFRRRTLLCAISRNVCHRFLVILLDVLSLRRRVALYLRKPLCCLLRFCHTGSAAATAAATAA